MAIIKNEIPLLEFDTGAIGDGAFWLTMSYLNDIVLAQCMSPVDSNGSE